MWDRIDESLWAAYEGIDQGALPDAVLQREETRELVQMALANLPPQYRDVLESKYLENHTLDAMAQVRDTSIDAVKSMLRRARAAFRECFLAIAKMEMSAPLNDKFLDDNLSRLLDGEIDTPRLSSENELRMLEQFDLLPLELLEQALAQKTPLVEKAEAKDGLIALDPWGQETRLTLRKYHIDVYIEDGIARTTIDQTFFNHYPWNSEGTFYFPLPPPTRAGFMSGA